MDVQKDFCPGGVLAVPSGDSIIPDLNKVISAFARAKLPIFFTRDWHPARHCSFKAQGGIWPPHCVQGTPGAEIHSRLVRPFGSVLISKGEVPDREAYSSFEGTDLAERLRKVDVTEIFIGGLTMEYCVRNSAKDALRDGFAVRVLLDCVKGLEIHDGDSVAALREVKDAGATTVKSSDVIELVGAQQ